MIVRRSLIPVAFVLFLGLVPAAADAGTRAHPTPLDTYAKVGHDWKVKVRSVVRNANQVVADENQFNDRPRRGYQYVMVTVRGKKTSAGKGNLFWDLDYQLLGRKTHHLYDIDFQVIPHDLSDQDDVLKGGVVTGNVLFEVKKSDVTSGGMKLDVESFLDNPVSWYKFAR